MDITLAIVTIPILMSTFIPSSRRKSASPIPVFAITVSWTIVTANSVGARIINATTSFHPTTTTATSQFVTTTPLKNVTEFTTTLPLQWSAGVASTTKPEMRQHNTTTPLTMTELPLNSSTSNVTKQLTSEVSSTRALSAAQSTTPFIVQCSTCVTRKSGNTTLKTPTIPLITTTPLKNITTTSPLQWSARVASTTKPEMRQHNTTTPLTMTELPLNSSTSNVTKQQLTSEVSSTRVLSAAQSTTPFIAQCSSCVTRKSGNTTVKTPTIPLVTLKISLTPILTSNHTEGPEITTSVTKTPLMSRLTVDSSSTSVTLKKVLADIQSASPVLRSSCVTRTLRRTASSVSIEQYPAAKKSKHTTIPIFSSFLTTVLGMYNFFTGKISITQPTDSSTKPVNGTLLTNMSSAKLPFFFTTVQCTLEETTSLATSPTLSTKTSTKLNHTDTVLQTSTPQNRTTLTKKSIAAVPSRIGMGVEERSNFPSSVLIASPVVTQTTACSSITSSGSSEKDNTDDIDGDDTEPGASGSGSGSGNVSGSGSGSGIDGKEITTTPQPIRITSAPQIKTPFTTPLSKVRPACYHKGTYYQVYDKWQDTTGCVNYTCLEVPNHNVPGNVSLQLQANITKCHACPKGYIAHHNKKKCCPDCVPTEAIQEVCNIVRYGWETLEYDSADHGLCFSGKPYLVTGCKGFCSTSSIASLRNKLSPECRFCQPIDTQVHNVNMTCANGANIYMKFYEIHQCGCSNTTCALSFNMS